ncbi:MAG: L,D-transpeptidase family protein, partial [Acidimicrobiales bacterium]
MRREILALAAVALLAGACSGTAVDDATETMEAGPTSVVAEPAGPSEQLDSDKADEVSPAVNRTETTETAGSDEESPSKVADEDADNDNSESEPVSAGSRPANGPDLRDVFEEQLTEPEPVDLASVLVPVEQGDNGDGVLALQSRLAELGFGPGNPDGSYGRRTVAAVEAFQGLLDLDVTGTADAKTLSALTKYRYDGLIVRAGDEGDDVETLQLLLSEGPFDPGPIDGAYGTGTKQAVWALEKMAGIPVDGDWGPLEAKAWQQLLDGEIGGPEKSHDTRWVEVDLSEQIIKVYDPESTNPVLISHASSGSGIRWENEEHSGSSVTPLGDFTISRRISGWRESSLNIGRLYNPLYFNG